MSHQALPNEAVDLNLAKQCQGGRLQHQPIARKFKESLLCRPDQVWNPAQLEAVNDETLPFVDLVRAKVADVSAKGSLDFLWCSFHQLIRGKFPAIGTHERNRHVFSWLVHDPSKRIGSQGRVEELTIGLFDLPRQQLPCAKELLLYGTLGRSVPRKKLAAGEAMRSSICSSRHANLMSLLWMGGRMPLSDGELARRRARQMAPQPAHLAPRA